ncbi:hypothetical protein EBZ80_13710 [bacterium]|nr:hypothetical protein [bacterium]
MKKKICFFFYPEMCADAEDLWMSKEIQKCPGRSKDVQGDPRMRTISGDVLFMFGKKRNIFFFFS